MLVTRTMNHLVPCPCCARHVRPAEPACPFCGLTLEQASRGETGTTPWYAIAALSTTLVLSGCEELTGRYGEPPQSEDPARVMRSSARESVDIYGAPPPRPEQPQNSAPRRRTDPGGLVEAYGAPPPPRTTHRDR
jgi:hypothetical protein